MSSSQSSLGCRRSDARHVEFARTRPGARWVERSLAGPKRPACYSPNTYSLDAVEVSLSSGAFGMTEFGCFEPTSTAMYCLPLTAKLTGGALMPVPALKLQTSFNVLASWAD